MAGLYIHIPFCAQACHYCDFHFSTNQEKRNEMVEAISKEITLQKEYLGNDPITTIYFGGGTPSLLSTGELSNILNTISETFSLANVKEVTLEANPDDLTTEKLRAFKTAGVTRLSIGIQSFNDPVLQFLNRSHRSKTAIESIHKAHDAGFSNISIDLIYAIPDVTLSEWDENINQAIDLDVAHISAYTLTIEPNTVFGKYASTGKLKMVPDEIAATQMEFLIERLEAAGYLQYEVSNFCRAGWESKHNSNYWCQEKYLGVGPSSHSYNKESRQFNISNNHMYLRSMGEGKIPFTMDMLTTKDKINEYILTSLRTVKGCSLLRLRDEFSFDLGKKQAGYLEQLIQNGLARIEGDTLMLTRRGLLIADKIASDLFEL